MNSSEFWVIVYNLDDVEYTEMYEDFYEARTNYVTMCNNDQFIAYAVLQHVTIDDIEGEVIDVVDSHLL